MPKPDMPQPYKSPNLPTYEQGTQSAAMNRLGATGPVSGAGMYNYGGNWGGTNAGGYSGYAPTGGVPYPSGGQTSGWNGRGGALRFNGQNGFGSNQSNGGFGGSRGGSNNYFNKMQGQDQSQQFNFGNAGAPLGGPAGIGVATAGYNWDPQNQAIRGFQSGLANNSPYQFNFSNLPNEYTQQAYQQGASGINRAGQNALTQAQEAIGTRRPGLLMNTAEQSQRDTNQNLANLATSLNLNRINQNIATQQAQQGAQAAENRASQGMGLNYLQGLYNSGQGLVNTQSGLLQNERGYQDQALQYLKSLYDTASGQANSAAAIGTQQQNSAFNNLLGLGGLGVNAAGLFGGLGGAGAAAGLGGLGSAIGATGAGAASILDALPLLAI